MKIYSIIFFLIMSSHFAFSQHIATRNLYPSTDSLSAPITDTVIFVAADSIAIADTHAMPIDTTKPYKQAGHNADLDSATIAHENHENHENHETHAPAPLYSDNISLTKIITTQWSIQDTRLTEFTVDSALVNMVIIENTTCTYGTISSSSISKLIIRNSTITDLLIEDSTIGELIIDNSRIIDFMSTDSYIRKQIFGVYTEQQEK